VSISAKDRWHDRGNSCCEVQFGKRCAGKTPVPVLFLRAALSTVETLVSWCNFVVRMHCSVLVAFHSQHVFFVTAALVVRANSIKVGFVPDRSVVSSLSAICLNTLACLDRQTDGNRTVQLQANGGRD
jgi:hypothetical protein